MATPEQIEFRKKWAAELRSGKWKQGHCKLHRDGKFCCLGVAFVLGFGTLPPPDESGCYLHVNRALGVHEDTGHVNFVRLNDYGKLSFVEIADRIGSDPSLFVEAKS